MTIKLTSEADALTLIERVRATPLPDKSMLDGLMACALDFALFEDVHPLLERIAADPAQSEETKFLATYNQGALLTGRRSIGGAIAQMEKAKTFKPDSPDVLVSLSRLHRLQHQHDQAIECAERALAANPAHGGLYAEVMRSYQWANKQEVARAKYASDAIPTHDPLARGSALFDLEEMGLADQALQTTASFIPPDVLRQQAVAADPLARIYPEVEGVWPSDPTKPVYFMACDQRYFDTYATPFSASVGRLGNNRALHVHVYDPTRPIASLTDELKRSSGLTQVSVTAERLPQPDKVYYSSARFLRFAQLLARHDAPAACLDADSLVVRDVFQPTEADIVGLERPEFANLTQRFYAACLIVQPSDRARTFLDMLASFIALAFQAKRAIWYVDQMGLALTHYVLVGQEQRVTWQNAAHQQIQYQHLTDDAWVWAGKGPSKAFPDLPDVPAV